MQNLKKVRLVLIKNGKCGPSWIKLYVLKAMKNPPKENPRNKNDQNDVCPRYSGERNRKGTPNPAANLSETNPKRITQKMSANKLCLM